jgi:hypothetical protein
VKGRVKPKQRGTPEEHLRYMLKTGLKWADGAGVAAAAAALLPHLGASSCPRVDADCRPGACDCDGAHDALAHALSLYEIYEKGQVVGGSSGVKR